MIFDRPLVYPDALYKRLAKEGSKWSREHAKPVPATLGEPRNHVFRRVGAQTYNESCLEQSNRSLWIGNLPQIPQNKVKIRRFSISIPCLYHDIPPDAKIGDSDLVV